MARSSMRKVTLQEAADGSYVVSSEGVRYYRREECEVIGKKPYCAYVGKMMKYHPDDDGNKYAAFLGIPYAVAPQARNLYQVRNRTGCE